MAAARRLGVLVIGLLYVMVWLLHVGRTRAKQQFGDYDIINDVICSGGLSADDLQMFLSSHQCPLESTTSVTSEPDAVTQICELTWDTEALEDEGRGLELALHGIRQYDNGTLSLEALMLGVGVANTGRCGLPAWTDHALSLLRVADWPVYLTLSTASTNHRPCNNPGQCLEERLSSCPPDILLHHTQASATPAQLRPKHTDIPNIQQEKSDESRPSTKLTKAMKFNLKTNGESMSVGVASNDETVGFKIKVGTKKKGSSFSFKFGSKSKPKETDGEGDKEGTEETVATSKNRLGSDTRRRLRELHERFKDSVVYQVMMGIRHSYLYVADQCWRGHNYLSQNFHEYAERQCLSWHQLEKDNPTDVSEVPLPPCSLEEATGTKLFKPDTSCNSGRGYCDFFHKGAYHCIVSSTASASGAGAQACYDREGQLLGAEEGGGNYDKAHPDGLADVDWAVFPPQIRTVKIWRLSHFIEDIIPFLMCCKFTKNCERYREVRPTITTCRHYDY